jgi:multidrug efflux pump subunit AcrA (membrane-fusion protein)
MANKAIGDATVRSPIDGLVLEKRLQVGEYATMVPPSPVLVLQDQSTLELKFRLPERALSTIHQGDKVSIAIPALGVTRDATISEIAPMVDTRTRTIELTAVLTNTDGALRPGLMAEVKLGGPS